VSQRRYVGSEGGIKVMTGIRLDEYSTTPLYNIKAVVQTTGISPSTLRAWERRYNMCHPQRSESGYRLYSDRDIAIIRWLKTQVEAGMAISQAVAWLDVLNNEGDSETHAVLPGAPPPSHDTRHQLQATRTEVRSSESLRDDLVHTLLNFDESGAAQVLSEAFSLYSVEEVGEDVISQVLVEIGERWHRGELSITSEHFATSYLLQRLAMLLRTLPNLTQGPIIWVGCAPNELHEGGAVLLALYMRRAGYHVHYLGQNLPVDDFINEVGRQQPSMVLFSATTAEAAEGLSDMTQRLAAIATPRPMIGYGGRAFIKHPDLRNDIAGIYLGDSAHEAVDMVRDLLDQSQAHPSKGRGSGNHQS
jgi:methanogenic corrinoid protein MtbC1